MALRMSGPVKHPKTGMYQLRVRVPPDIRALIKKGEVVKSLGTKDPNVAKRAYVAERAKLDLQWENLRKGPHQLSEREADSIAAPLTDWWLSAHYDNPSEQKFWTTDLYTELWPSPKVPSGLLLDFTQVYRIQPDANKLHQMRSWCERQADEIIARNGYRVSTDDRQKIVRGIAKAIQKASLLLKDPADGKEVKSIITHFKSVTSAPSASVSPPSSETITFDKLVDGWEQEKKPSQKTAYEWRRVLKQLSSFVGHNNAERVTIDDIVSWKKTLVDAGQRPKTIRDAQLAPVRAVFRWGVENRLIKSNPADDVTISVRVLPGEARRGFTEAEATQILVAALASSDPVYRWIPWICAYTGARLSEICQLRKIDVRQIENVWCFSFDPAAGSLKNAGSERVVPIHSALIDAGFLTFTAAVSDGPIFADLPPDKWGNRGGIGTKRIGKWVRSIGLTDSRLAPAHSWRHRFKTASRRHGLASDIVDALCGHTPRTVGDRYGEYPIEALVRELEKLPHLL